MPTTFANTIDENEILAKRSQCDYAGNDIQTTYATKRELPTATSDLTNDSDFITSSDIPVKDVQVSGTSVVNAQGIAEISIPQTGVLDVEVNGSSVVNAQGVAEIAIPTFTQVNADWDASSGVQEILNKPDLSIYAESSDLATVATSGSYNDLLDKPSIPSAQVNADWDATSGVSAILNKPNLATVATTGDYSDLQNLPSIPAAQVNSDWDATSGVSQILNKPTIPSGTQLVPAATSADADKVLTVNAQGIPAWATGGGGGTNADWTESDPTAPSYIENKPTPKTLTAGANISISEGVGTLTISAAAGLPASTSADEGKCLVVDSNGDPEWGTGGKTYTGTDGVVVDNVNDTVGLEAPVDIVAGSGIAIDNPDGNTVRVSLASTPYNETVLWENYTFASNKSSSVVMSEDPFNFSCVRITFEIEASSETWPTVQTQIVDMVALTSCVNKYFTLNGTCVNGTTVYVRCSKCHFNGTAISDDSSVQWYNGGAGTMSGPLHIYRIVGINRIAGGN